MPRYTTILIGLLIFATFGTNVLSLFGFEQNRQINLNLEHLGQDFFTNRVKLFAIPMDYDGITEFDKIDRLQWHDIRLEMLKYRNQIEPFEHRPTTVELVAIVLFLVPFAAIMIYSPALWVAEFRIGNEWEKLIFNVVVGLMMIFGTLLRFSIYFWINRHNYNQITVRARPIVERLGNISLPRAIHFCFYGNQLRGLLGDEQTDVHWLSPETHKHMDRVAAAAAYCHPEFLSVVIIIFSLLSVLVHVLLSIRVSRLNKSQLELLNEMEGVESFIKPLEEGSEDEVLKLFSVSKGKKSSSGELAKQLSLFPERKPENAFYTKDASYDETTNREPLSTMETLMNPDELNELREIYLNNYLELKRQKKISKPTV